MLQFYFLSIALNALAGYMLFTGDNDDILEFKSGFSLKDETFRLIVGILSAITGLLKILSAIDGDVPVVGDLFPALTGLLCGFILIFDYYRGNSSLVVSENSKKVNQLILKNRKIIGIIAIIAAVLHFLFPKVLLL